VDRDESRCSTGAERLRRFAYATSTMRPSSGVFEMIELHRGVFGALALLSACAVAGDREPFGASEATVGPMAEESGTATASTSANDDGDSTALVTTADDDGTGEDSGGSAIRCDKIDFLFVIEAPLFEPEGQIYDDYGYSSISYKLIEGFATLVSQLYVAVAVDDFRVLVTGSQAVQPGIACSPDNTDGCPELEIDACDPVLGAGRNGVGIPEYESAECMPGRFMESGMPNLEGTFGCLVDFGGFETANGYGWYGGPGPDVMMNALSAATSTDNSCNAGFLRDDALLVVVLVAPNLDPLLDSSSGDLEAWTEALVAAKGTADNIAVLGLVADGDLDQPLCDPSTAGAFPAQLRDFVDGFTHGKWASSCIPDYTTFFTVAADVIDAACEEFVPVG
jgi:hypothetical protein